MKLSNEAYCLQQRFTVSYDYPVYFSQYVFAPDNLCLVNSLCRKEKNQRQRLFFIADNGLMQAQSDLFDQIMNYIHVHEQFLELANDICVVEGGEACKNDPLIVLELQQKLQQCRIDRQSHVVALGGGAFLDMAGYVAATTHRGIRLTRLPTTVLSQNDSGIGVKNAINAFNSKNFIGSFAPPFAVINDLQFISSLETRDKRAGIAEAVKVALIRDADFYLWLEKTRFKLATFDLTVMGEMIQRCAILHGQHIAQGGDPFELTNARPLDFGHWAAHKLESLTNYELRHGEAVAIGIALDCRYAVEVGLLDEKIQQRIHILLHDLGFSLWHSSLVLDKIIDGLQEFREHLGGELCITLLGNIAQVVEVNQMNEIMIGRALTWLKNNYQLCN